jgi:hypothetical protein
MMKKHFTKGFFLSWKNGAIFQFYSKFRNSGLNLLYELYSKRVSDCLDDQLVNMSSPTKDKAVSETFSCNRQSHVLSFPYFYYIASLYLLYIYFIPFQFTA